MKRLMKLLAMVGLAVSLVGCGVGQEHLRATGTRLATYKVTGSDIQRVNTVGAYAKRMVEDIEAGRLVTIGAISRETDRVVRMLSSNPVEAASWSELIGLIVQELNSTVAQKMPEVDKIHEIILPRLKNVMEATDTMKAFIENE
jgi:hypothetical protein